MNYPMNYRRYNSYTQSCNTKLSHTVECHTRPAFEAMEKIVYTFNKIAHALNSTLMATHSGFVSLLQLSHQLRAIKRSCSHILGLFSLLRCIKKKLSKTSDVTFSVREFEAYTTKQYSKLPWLLALFLALGVPAAMHTYSSINSNNISKSVALSQPQKGQASLEEKKTFASSPIKLDFARALYSFQAESPNELSLRPNDLIAILSKDDNDWWCGRLKNGKVGYFPANHVEIIEKNIEIPKKPAIAPSA